jgi:predicted Zn-dependent protease
MEQVTDSPWIVKPFSGSSLAERIDQAAIDKVEFSWSDEQRLGAAQLAVLKRDLRQRRILFTENGKDAQYVARLVAGIRPLMQQANRYRELHVYVADMQAADAYTLAGGHVIVSRGMLEAAGSEAALVCVIGHELAHLDCGHLLRRAKQVKLAQQPGRRGQRSFTINDFASNSQGMQALLQPFGPTEELEADKNGIVWACKLGYDPRALHHLLVSQADKQGNSASSFMPAFFGTHPPSTERREQVAAVYVELQAAEPRTELYVGRLNLEQRLTQEQKRFDE